MIEAEQTIDIDAPIDGVWDYVRDIKRWANLMPGLKECEVINDNDSRWTLKVGAGGLVRTVRVLVHVDQWDGPKRVNFSYKLEGDPVEGGGTYVASRKEARVTEVALKVRVQGGGSMAQMWEAMGRPLLPQFVKAFAGQLKAEIEATVVQAAEASATRPRSGFIAWLQSVWRGLFGRKPQQSTK